jgi:hypothetical protein
VNCEEESFLARWSRRKLEEEQAPTGLRDTEEPEPPGDDDMPPLESLDEDSDYSLFLSPGVSKSLRRMALRKLFHGAEFNVVDGLDDYAEDFTSFAGLGELVTGEMRRRLEQALEPPGDEADEPAGEVARGDESPAENRDGKPMDEEVG